METPLEEVTEEELHRAFIGAALDSLHVALPATVTAYDSTKQVVAVTLGCNRSIPDGAGNFVSETLPPLSDVPVCFPRSAQFSVTFPIAVGDGGLVVFAERNIGAWRATGQVGDPGDLGKHTLDGAVFFPGLFPDAAPSLNADPTNMVFGSETNPTSSAIVITPSSGGKLGSTAGKGIARAGDPVKIDSGSLATWMAQVEAAVNLAAPGSVTPLSPTFLSSPGVEIKSGSSKWTAAD